MACMVLSLEYIHKKRIMHRDIKPANFVFDSNGYLHLTDFGISKVKTAENFRGNSGTPGYMAPEVIFSKRHSFDVDFFAMGVILYEIIVGRQPYKARDKKLLRELVRAK